MKRFLFIAFLILLTTHHLFGQENRFEPKKTFEDLIVKAEELKAESQYDSAVAIFNFIKDKAESEDDTLYLMKSNLGIASVFFFLQETKVARNYYRQIIKLSKAINDSTHLNKSFYGIGGTYQIDDNLDSAFYYYEMTLPYFIREKKDEDVALILSNLASLHYRKGEVDLAI
ncbi:MAG: hypothetical protein WBB27_11540, partial [Maribacter sp.]